MKIWFLTLFAMLLSGCGYFYHHIEVSGSTPGIENGDVTITDQSGEAVFGALIKNGKFYIRKQELKNDGYYNLHVSTFNKPFEIYLEPGKYSMVIKPDENNYPAITSSSKIQNELTNYHEFADPIFSKYNEENRSLLDQLKTPALSLEQYNLLIEKLKLVQKKTEEAPITVLIGYLKRFPDSEVIAHILSQMNYESKPEKFFELYQKFGKSAKNSDDGIEIGRQLKALVRLQPGALAPTLEGKTPDNKMIDIKEMHKKIIIVDFWKASLMISRENHQWFINNLLPKYESKGVGIISVSLDTKPDWWTSAIKEDRMTWPQVSDLKGSASQNIKNWNINILPTYDILDGTGHIIERDVQYQEISIIIDSYLDKH